MGSFKGLIRTQYLTILQNFSFALFFSSQNPVSPGLEGICEKYEEIMKKNEGNMKKISPYI